MLGLLQAGGGGGRISQISPRRGDDNALWTTKRYIRKGKRKGEHDVLLNSACSMGPGFQFKGEA